MELGISNLTILSEQSRFIGRINYKVDEFRSTVETVEVKVNLPWDLMELEVVP